MGFRVVRVIAMVHNSVRSDTGVCMRELGPEYISSLLTEVLNPPVPV